MQTPKFSHWCVNVWFRIWPEHESCKVICAITICSNGESFGYHFIELRACKIDGKAIF